MQMLIEFVFCQVEFDWTREEEAITFVQWMDHSGSLTQQSLEKFYITSIQLQENANGKANLTRFVMVTVKPSQVSYQE